MDQPHPHPERSQKLDSFIFEAARYIWLPKFIWLGRPKTDPKKTKGPKNGPKTDLKMDQKGPKMDQ